MSGAQAPYARVPFADGTLVSTSELPSNDLLPAVSSPPLTSSELGWFAADAANVKAWLDRSGRRGSGRSVCSVFFFGEANGSRAHHCDEPAPEARQKLAKEFGATDIVTERGDEGVARIKELTKGVGADSVLECVGTQESMMQAIQCTRPGGSIGYVGVPHGKFNWTDSHSSSSSSACTVVLLRCAGTCLI